jgi:hypothetical protein
MKLWILIPKPGFRGATNSCRLFWLTNSAQRGGGVVGSQPMSRAVHMEPNQTLEIYGDLSIFNQRLDWTGSDSGGGAGGGGDKQNVSTGRLYFYLGYEHLKKSLQGDVTESLAG